MRKVLFWSAAGTVLYTYVLFPALVMALGRRGPRPWGAVDELPRVSVVLAAHNEVDRLGQKLESLAQLDYPRDRLEVVVASDGSTDGTVDLVRSYAEAEADLFRVVDLARAGKAVALNAAVSASSGDVLVFTDADGRLARDALRAIVRPFADPRVGGAAGDERYVSGDAAVGAAAGELSYWSLDRALKLAESNAGHVISATGSLYAIRKRLFRPIPEGVTDDFFTSTGVIAQGFRLVFAPDAVVYTQARTSNAGEYRRKVRVMTRGLTGVLLRRELLDPRRHGFYALQLASHKVLRRLMVFPLLAIAATAPALAPRGLVYRAAAVAQLVVYGLGAIGLLAGSRGRSKSRVLALPAYFCLVNAASLHAVWNLVRGRRIAVWQPAGADAPDRHAERGKALG